MQELIEKILISDKRAVSRAISMVENEAQGSIELLKSIYKYTGKSYKIGITGPPGSGKSTITNNLIKLLSSKGYKTGVIAVDPTSPFTGGALLGDRVRMTESGSLENVFIRSMATRGSLGGLCKNVVETCDVLEAAGKDFIIIETVGVGQSELDIAQTTDTVIVVLVPESGDAVQAMKAGLMEIADIFVLNKSDRDGSDAVVATIKNIIHLKAASEDGWAVNVLKTIGTKNEGIEELFDEVLNHKAHLENSGFLNKRRLAHLKGKILDLVNNRLYKTFWNEENKKTLDEHLNGIYERTSDPYSFAEKIT